MSKSYTKAQKAVDRGNDLLLPVEATVDDVVALTFPLGKFRDAATVKTWAKNHGLPVLEVNSGRDGFAVKCREHSAFVDGTHRSEAVGKAGVVASLAEPKPIVADDPEPEPEPEPEPVLESVPDEVEKRYSRVGELFVVSKILPQDTDETVRMVGIVMMPEVPDAEGDVTSAEEIEGANLEFMKSFGTTGLMHQVDASDKIHIIQNVIAPTDILYPLEDGTTKTIAKGTWYQELWSDDPDVVKRVKVDKTLTGLSIGGFAERVPITLMRGDVIDVVVPDSYEPAFKRKVEERVAKAEGDPALNRFVNLRVEEVSVVDAAANEEEFFIIKRRKEMSKPKDPAAEVSKNIDPAPEKKPEAKAAETPTPENEPKPVEKTEPSIAGQVAEGVKAGVAAAFEGLQAKAAKPEPESEPEPEPEPESESESENEPESESETEIAKELRKIGERLDGLEKRQDGVEKSRAVAKGAASPEDAPTPEPEAPEKVSKWAGTPIAGRFKR